jgi:SAM-dependent methyltransferase
MEQPSSRPTHQLNDDQLEIFDQEYVHDGLWKPIKACIDRDFPDGRFRFLDVGGGNGVFADRILAAYPESTGAVLDNSAMLLERNQPNPRKALIAEGAENLASLAAGRFDLICMNWLLHHMIGRSFRETRANMVRVLRDARAALTPRGRISIYDNMYDGWLIDNAPGWIIYQATSSRSLAGLARMGGANTAGIGVCFQSHESWRTLLGRAGIGVVDYNPEDYLWKIPLHHTLLLHIGSIRNGHFWGKAA